MQRVWRRGWLVAEALARTRLAAHPNRLCSLLSSRAL